MPSKNCRFLPKDTWSKKRLDSPCKLWLDGCCPKTEEECDFAHAGKVEKVPKLCKYYFHSHCKKAKACPFMHETYPCVNFALGNCDAGDECKLSHAALDDETRAMIKEDLLAKKSRMMDEIYDETDEDERKRLIVELRLFQTAATTKVGIVDLGVDIDDAESLLKIIHRKDNDSKGQEVDYASYSGPNGGHSQRRYALHSTSGNFRYAQNNLAKFEAYDEMERRILTLYNEISIDRYEAISEHLRILD